MPTKCIAIHQPNLFPWMGFFAKIFKSEAFVFLDHVILNPRTSIYTKRVKIISNKQEFWLTVPLKNKSEQTFQRICEMEIDKPQIIADKHLKTIELNYKKAPFFNETFPFIHKFYTSENNLISFRNIEFIKSLCEALGQKKEFIVSSHGDYEKSSTEMLIDIVLKNQGTTYLSGDGVEGYQKDELYAKNKIDLSFMDYKQPSYKQFNLENFAPGLSIIDALMNLGLEGTKNILVQSVNKNIS